MTSSAFAIFVILSVFGVILSQRAAAARARKGFPWNEASIPWRYRDMEKRVAGGPFPAWLVYGVGVIAFVNMAVFFVFALTMGGDALSGHQAGGRYFLGSKRQLTEVSRGVYLFSLWQVGSVFVTTALGLLTWAIATRNTARG